MTKHEFALKLYEELKQNQDVQNIARLIKTAKKNNKTLSVEEQLDVVDLIRQIHIERTREFFESVDVFLTLVNHVEEQIKVQNNTNSGGED